ncbi:MAG: 3'(2'),5'-bisphosphate nucleotidase CysQ [Pseudomonadota bacterium]
MQQLNDLIQPLLDLCFDAGAIVCDYYRSPQEAKLESKSDQSPLTLADTASHACLVAGLETLTPGYPVLSEESSPEALAGRRGWNPFWLVDPLDGTKEFLAETGEFTINIALIKDHQPALGIVYVPLKQQACIGIPSESAFLYSYSKESSWTRQALPLKSSRERGQLRVLASRRHNNDRLRWCLDWLTQRRGKIQRIDAGSALKFCQLACGEGDLYPRFSPSCEWDTAAGQAVLEAAGGAVWGMDGKAPRYNLSDSLFSPHFYAVADPSDPLWQQLLAETPR